MAHPKRTRPAPADAPPADRYSFLFDLPAVPPERVACPAPYDAYWVEMALDLPSKDVPPTNLALLTRVVTAWNLTTDGAPVPPSEAALNALADQAPRLFLWLCEEWHRRRFAPLAPTPTRPNGALSPPNGASNGRSLPTPTANSSPGGGP